LAAVFSSAVWVRDNEFPQTQHGKDRNKCEQVQDIARSSLVRDADFVLGKTPKAAQLDERRLNVGK